MTHFGDFSRNTRESWFVVNGTDSEAKGPFYFPAWPVYACEVPEVKMDLKIVHVGF